MNKNALGIDFPPKIEELTLRDYFAAQAMNGFLVGCMSPPTDSALNRLAVLSYVMADAMLKARAA